MSTRTPSIRRLPALTLRLPHRLGVDGFDLPRLLSDNRGRLGRIGPELVARFALRSHERAFALRLLRSHTNVWVFRCDQRAFCGDFVLVDMSAPCAARRAAYAVELKQRTPLRVDRGRGGVQLANRRLALSEIARSTGALDASSPVSTLLGDAAEVLAFFAGRVRAGSRTPHRAWHACLSVRASHIKNDFASR